MEACMRACVRMRAAVWGGAEACLKADVLPLAVAVEP